MNSVANTEQPHSSPASADEISSLKLPALLERARLAKADGRMRDGLALARRAWELLGPEEQGAGDAQGGEAAAEAGCLIVHFNFRSGHFPEALEFGRQMLQSLTQPGHALLRTDVLRSLVGSSLELGDFENALNLATECHALAESLGDVTERARACALLAACYSGLGDHEHAEQLMLDALALGDQGPPGVSRLMPLNNLCATSIRAYFQRREASDPDGAKAALERCFGYARRLQDGLAQMQAPDPTLCAFATGNLGEALLHLGHHDEAEQRLSDTLSVAQSLGLGSMAWRMHYLLAEVHLGRGMFEQARGLLQQVLLADGNAVGMPTLERVHLALYRCCKELGLLQQALEHLEVGRRMGMQRTQAQLAVQARLFVTRLEADRSRQMAERAQGEARRQEALAQAYSEAAMTDPLTGLHNRRHLESRLPALMAAARDAGRPMSLAMMDLDHFKSVNDRFGHPVGDEVLIRLARILRERMRSEDHLVRMGGEEILVVLSGAAPSLAMEICDRLRQAIGLHPWSDLQADLSVTISIGLASSPGYDLQELIDRADRALYQAKKAGRNRVCAAGPG